MLDFSGHKRRLPFSAFWIAPAVFILVFALFWTGVTRISGSAVLQEQESLERALRQDIIHCYAVEGFYPPSLAYMKEHYGLVYDESLFYVDYRPVAQNLMPDVTVLAIRESGS